MSETNLDITGGLPYNRRIRIKDGVNVWATEDEFEVRCQVRVAPHKTATLKSTLSSFFIPSIDANDIVLDLRLSGADTRTLSSGYYDVIVSDVGSVDTRGLRVLYGQIQVEQLITGA